MLPKSGKTHSESSEQVQVDPLQKLIEDLNKQAEAKRGQQSRLPNLQEKLMMVEKYLT